MTEPEIAPAAGVDVAPADYYKYTIESPKEVAYILRALAGKGELVTAHFNRGSEFILTAVIDVDADNERVFLDFGSDDELNRRILHADKVLFVTTQDRVKVQFSVDSIYKTRYGGRDAFQIPLPESMLKFQRREFYRVTTPIATPLKCQVTLPNGGKVELGVADISIGGVALVGVPETMNIEAGTEYDGCRIILPDVGTVMAKIEIRNHREVTTRTGQVVRAGCCFVNLTPNMQVMIQRYIIKLDRERRAKLADD